MLAAVLECWRAWSPRYPYPVPPRLFVEKPESEGIKLFATRDRGAHDDFQWDPLGKNQSWCKCMVILRKFLLVVHFLGWVTAWGICTFEGFWEVTKWKKNIFSIWGLRTLVVSNFRDFFFNFLLGRRVCDALHGWLACHTSVFNSWVLGAG